MATGSHKARTTTKLFMKTFKTDIVAEMQPGDVVTLELQDTAECSTYGTLAWRYSKIKGRSQGKYIHTCLDYDHCQVHLVCTTYEEYEKERNKLLPIKWWKAMIAKKA